MRNPFIVHQKSPEVTEITSWSKASKIYVSPDGHWILTIDGPSMMWWKEQQPVITILHVATSRQQEVAFNEWESWAKDTKMKQQGIEIVEFARDEKNQVSYVMITYCGLKALFRLGIPWIECIKEDIYDSLDYQVAEPQKLCRFIIEGKMVKVCHPTKVNAEPFATILHDSNITEAQLLRSELFGCNLVLTQDESFVLKLTRVKLE